MFVLIPIYSVLTDCWPTVNLFIGIKGALFRATTRVSNSPICYRRNWEHAAFFFPFGWLGYVCRSDFSQGWDCIYPVSAIGTLQV